MIINKSGMTIRIPVADIRVTGRAAQGVKVINLRATDSIASIFAVPKSEVEAVIVIAEEVIVEGAVVAATSDVVVDNSIPSDVESLVERAIEDKELQEQENELENIK